MILLKQFLDQIFSNAFPIRLMQYNDQFYREIQDENILMLIAPVSSTIRSYAGLTQIKNNIDLYLSVDHPQKSPAQNLYLLHEQLHDLISFFDTYKSSLAASLPMCTAYGFQRVSGNYSVVSSYDTHDWVLKVMAEGGNQGWMRYDIGSNEWTTGFISFYVRQNTDGVAQYICISSDTGGDNGIKLLIDTDKKLYYYNPTKTYICDFDPSSEWKYVKILFDAISHSFNIEIDGTWYNDLDFTDDSEYLRYLHFKTTDTGADLYIDAFHYSYNHPGFYWEINKTRFEDIFKIVSYTPAHSQLRKYQYKISMEVINYV